MICQIFNSILNNCFEGSVRVVLGVFSFEYRFESLTYVVQIFEIILYLLKKAGWGCFFDSDAKLFAVIEIKA